MKTRKVILDVDPGIDDAVAVLMSDQADWHVPDHGSFRDACCDIEAMTSDPFENWNFYAPYRVE